MKLRLIFILLICYLSASAQIRDTATQRAFINANVLANNTRSITAPSLNTILNGFLNIMQQYKVSGIDSVSSLNDSTIRIYVSDKNGTRTYDRTIRGIGSAIAGALVKSGDSTKLGTTWVRDSVRQGIVKLKAFPSTTNNIRNDPADLAALKNGHIALFAQTYHHSGSDADTSDITYAIDNLDNGHSWQPQVIAFPHVGFLGDYEPSVARRSDDSLIMIFLRQTGALTAELWQADGSPDATVWVNLHKVYGVTGKYYAPASGRLKLLKDGRWVYPFNELISGDGSSGSSTYYGHYLTSTDNLTTWSLGSNVIRSSDSLCAEPGIEQFANGNILYYYRTKSGYIGGSLSTDGMTTFKTFGNITGTYGTDIGLINPNANINIKFFENKNVLVAFHEGLENTVDDRYTLWLDVSYDNGASWSKKLRVDSSHGYKFLASAFSIIDNELLLTYTRYDSATQSHGDLYTTSIPLHHIEGEATSAPLNNLTINHTAVANSSPAKPWILVNHNESFDPLQPWYSQKKYWALQNFTADQNFYYQEDLVTPDNGMPPYNVRVHYPGGFGNPAFKIQAFDYAAGTATGDDVMQVYDFTTKVFSASSSGAFFNSHVTGVTESTSDSSKRFATTELLHQYAASLGGGGGGGADANAWHWNALAAPGATGKLGTSDNNNIDVYTNNTQYWRFANSGALLGGQTSNAFSGKLAVTGNIDLTTGDLNILTTGHGFRMSSTSGAQGNNDLLLYTPGSNLFNLVDYNTGNNGIKLNTSTGNIGISAAPTSTDRLFTSGGNITLQSGDYQVATAGSGIRVFNTSNSTGSNDLYIWRPSSNIFAIGDYSSSNNGLRINTSTGTVGMGGNADPSARLDVQSTTQGVLISRMTASQRDAISSPANGLMIYSTTDGCFYYYKSNAWQSLCSISSVEKDFTTTNATTINVDTIPISPGEHIRVEAVLDGVRDDGHVSVGAKRSRTFFMDDVSTITNGTLISSEPESYLPSGSGLSTASFTITSSGGLILIQFTGEASTTILGKITRTVTRKPAPL